MMLKRQRGGLFIRAHRILGTCMQLRLWSYLQYIHDSRHSILPPTKTRFAISLVTDRAYSNRSTSSHAPGHVRDDCTVSKDKGLNQERAEFFKSKTAWRITPDTHHVLGDQLHQVFERRVMGRLYWLIGHARANNLHTLRLVKTACRKDVQFAKHKGYKRSPVLFLFCLAVVIEKKLLSPDMVLATFCKCGFFDKADCYELFGVTLTALTEAEHAWHDSAQLLPSIGPPTGHQHPPTSKQQVLDVWQSEEDYKAMLLSLNPLSLDEMRELRNPAPCDAELDDLHIEPPEADMCPGALVKLAAAPDSTNVAVPDNFNAAFSAMLGKTKPLITRSGNYKRDIAAFQLYLLKRRYLVLKDFILVVHGPSCRADTHVRSNDIETPGGVFPWLHDLRSQ